MLGEVFGKMDLFKQLFTCDRLKFLKKDLETLNERRSKGKAGMYPIPPSFCS